MRSSENERPFASLRGLGGTDGLDGTGGLKLKDEGAADNEVAEIESKDSSR
jgi:hypothetical protein